MFSEYLLCLILFYFHLIRISLVRNSLNKILKKLLLACLLLSHTFVVWIQQQQQINVKIQPMIRHRGESWQKATDDFICSLSYSTKFNTITRFKEIVLLHWVLPEEGKKKIKINKATIKKQKRNTVRRNRRKNKLTNEKERLRNVIENIGMHSCCFS